MGSKTFTALVGALALIVPVIASAQEVPRVQVAGGYTLITRQNAVLAEAVSDEEGIGSRSGWFAEVAGNIKPYVGIVGQVSATYTTGTLRSRAWEATGEAYTLLGGARFNARCCGPLVPFAKVLLGAVRSSVDVTQRSTPVTTFSNVYSAWSVGGGADIRISGTVGVHAAVDFLRTDRSAQQIEPWTWRLHAGLIVPMH
jgi:hypothetical protein